MDTSDSVPAIDGVCCVPPRPRWSVMIPTFHCAHLLRETLESVLRQDPGAARMQIEVVDDCSTRDDPASVVAAVGKGRIGYFQQPVNQGVTRNFNTCLRRARGHLIHILHGDDLVEPTFYCEVEALAEQHPAAALLATRAFIVDEQGEIDGLNERLPLLAGPSTDASPYYYQNPFRTPAMVVRRAFYEQQGGFHEALCHTADWEMWLRALAFGGGVVLNRPLARYRVFAGNDTTRLMRTGENVRDFLRLASILESRHADFDEAKFRGIVAGMAMFQARHFAELGDQEAAAANQVMADLLLPPSPPAAEAGIEQTPAEAPVVAAAEPPPDLPPDPPQLPPEDPPRRRQSLLRKLEFRARHQLIKPLIRWGALMAHR